MLLSKLKPIINRYEEISQKLADSASISDVKLLTELSKEQSSIEEITQKAKSYIATL